MRRRKWGMKAEDVKVGMRVDVRENFGQANSGGCGLKVIATGCPIGINKGVLVNGLLCSWGSYYDVRKKASFALLEDLRPHIPRKQPKRDAAGKFAKKEMEPLKVGDLVDYVGGDLISKDSGHGSGHNCPVLCSVEMAATDWDVVE